jgi:ubiquinone/menaquinone biosynthesis C-methylase UbiE
MVKDASPDILNRLTRKGIFPHQFAFTLLIPARSIFLSPGKLISRLELKRDSQVLEVGPGPGYFSTHIAKVLTEGKLVLADIQKEMLDKARKRITRKRLKNVEFYLCDGEKFILPDSSFDVIFMVTVIGEIENREMYVKEFCRLLRKGGLLSISELRGDPDKMTTSEIRDLLKDSDFVFDGLFGNENNYTINFRRQ